MIEHLVHSGIVSNNLRIVTEKNNFLQKNVYNVFVTNSSGIMVKNKNLRHDYNTLLVRQLAMINGIMTNR